MRGFTADNPLKGALFAAAALAVLLLTGCGQKGGLYPPESSKVSYDSSALLIENGV